MTESREARDARQARQVLPTLRQIADGVGLQRVRMVAWRDLDDPESGGSELHAHRVAQLWARAGIDVTMETSRASGHPASCTRDGYSVVRRGGRYMVFPRVAARGVLRWSAPGDALVEIWNGMPFFSPIWHRGPRVTFIHHVHAEMWRMVLPGALARLGQSVERSLAPPFYRRTKVVTLSESSRGEIVGTLRLPPQNVVVVPPGIDPVFSPGGKRSPRPLVACVGRLVPVKRHSLVIDALVMLKRRHPGLQAVIAGEGYMRQQIAEAVRASGAEDWVQLPGRLPDDQLVDLYRRAWVLVSASAREGWGMTITEAAACGAPAVATKVVGQVDTVDSGVTGLLAADREEFVEALDTLLSDDGLREKLSKGALARASSLTWDATARRILQVLAAEVARAKQMDVDPAIFQLDDGRGAAAPAALWSDVWNRDRDPDMDHPDASRLLSEPSPAPAPYPPAPAPS